MRIEVLGVIFGTHKVRSNLEITQARFRKDHMKTTVNGVLVQFYFFNCFAMEATTVGHHLTLSTFRAGVRKNNKITFLTKLDELEVA